MKNRLAIKKIEIKNTPPAGNIKGGGTFDCVYSNLARDWICWTCDDSGNCTSPMPYHKGVS